MQKFKAFRKKNNLTQSDLIDRDLQNKECSEFGAFVPLLPISAQGGSLNDFMVSVKDSECERVVSPLRNKP